MKRIEKLKPDILKGALGLDTMLLAEPLARIIVKLNEIIDALNEQENPPGCQQCVVSRRAFPNAKSCPYCGTPYRKADHAKR